MDEKNPGKYRKNIAKNIENNVAPPCLGEALRRVGSER
jgi:hypothetical protein